MSKTLVLKRSRKRKYMGYVLTSIFFVLSIVFAFLLFNQDEDSSPTYTLCYIFMDLFFLLCLAFSVYSTLQKKEIRIAKEKDCFRIEEKKTYRIPLSSLENISYTDGGKLFSNGNLTFQVEGKKIQIKNITNAKANCLALQEMLSLNSFPLKNA